MCRHGRTQPDSLDRFAISGVATITKHRTGICGPQRRGRQLRFPGTEPGAVTPESYGVVTARDRPYRRDFRQPDDSQLIILMRIPPCLPHRPTPLS